MNQTAELERRIAARFNRRGSTALYRVGREARAWQRKLQYNKSGSIPKLRAEISAANEKVEALENMNEDIGSINQEMERLAKNKQQLERTRRRTTNCDARAARKKVLDAMEKGECGTKSGHPDKRAAYCKRGKITWG